jgi:hypothetical protein
MGISDLDEVQYDLEVDGTLVRKQLARRVWERAGWATVAITYTEKDKHDEWKPAKVALLRFRRIHDVWQRQAAMTLHEDEARELASWLTGPAGEGSP